MLTILQDGGKKVKQFTFAAQDYYIDLNDDGPERVQRNIDQHPIVFEL